MLSTPNTQLGASYLKILPVFHLKCNLIKPKQFEINVLFLINWTFQARGFVGLGLMEVQSYLIAMRVSEQSPTETAASKP